MKFDEKAIKKSQQRIGILLRVVQAVINYIVKTNNKLDKGIAKAKQSQAYHDELIKKAVDSIDQANDAIHAHEVELEKNAKLIKKLESFID